MRYCSVTKNTCSNINDMYVYIYIIYMEKYNIGTERSQKSGTKNIFCLIPIMWGSRKYELTYNDYLIGSSVGLVPGRVGGKRLARKDLVNVCANGNAVMVTVILVKWLHTIVNTHQSKHFKCVKIITRVNRFIHTNLAGAHRAPVVFQHPDLAIVFDFSIVHTIPCAVLPVGTPAVIATVQVEANGVIGTAVSSSSTFVNIYRQQKRHGMTQHFLVSNSCDQAGCLLRLPRHASLHMLTKALSNLGSSQESIIKFWF